MGVVATQPPSRMTNWNPPIPDIEGAAPQQGCVDVPGHITEEKINISFHFISFPLIFILLSIGICRHTSPASMASAAYKSRMIGLDRNSDQSLTQTQGLRCIPLHSTHHSPTPSQPTNHRSTHSIHPLFILFIPALSLLSNFYQLSPLLKSTLHPLFIFPPPRSSPRSRLRSLSVSSLPPGPIQTRHMMNWDSPDELRRVSSTPNPSSVAPVASVDTTLTPILQSYSRGSSTSSSVSMLGRLSTPCMSRGLSSCGNAPFNGLRVRPYVLFLSFPILLVLALIVLYFLCRYTLLLALIGL